MVGGKERERERETEIGLDSLAEEARMIRSLDRGMK